MDASWCISVNIALFLNNFEWPPVSCWFILEFPPTSPFSLSNMEFQVPDRALSMENLLVAHKFSNFVLILGCLIP